MHILEKKPKIALDGPAGAGKSSVARELARRLKIKYLDTGAMYRAITLKVAREKVDYENLKEVEELLNNTEIKITVGEKIFLDGEDVTAEIRSPLVNELVSPVSCISLVRKHLVAIQKLYAKESNGIIMEGRDIASRVMPEADIKIYLDASIKERARRRMKEQVEKGLALTMEEVEAEIKNRDCIDSQRADSPLTIVPDAVVIDTTGMSFEEVVAEIENIVNLEFYQRNRVN